MTLPLEPILAALLFLNIAAFAVIGFDKRRAIKASSRRVSERTLLLMGLPLAAPGMLAGMSLFRHKTRKRSFLWKAAGVVFANLLMAALIGWSAIKGHLRAELVLY